MWKYWKDLWLALGMAGCIFIAIILAYTLGWYTIFPTRTIGYHIEEKAIEQGRIKYYIVECIREHAANRTVYTTTVFDDAVRVLRTIQDSGEVE